MPDDRWPRVAAERIAWADTEQMIEVDRMMIEDLGLGLIQMMENAGRNLARLAIDHFIPATASVYVGTGGNGGGGLVAARHMANLGVDVSVVTTRDIEHFAPVPGLQLDILRRMGVAVVTAPVEADLAVDALIGYSLRGAPRGPAAKLIEHMNSTTTSVLSLDVPSGLDATTGQTPGLVVSADATLTLALPKRGLSDRPEVGRLFVGDISVPPATYASLDLVGAAPPFRTGAVLEIV